jgi:hypothetical protein
MPGTVEAKGSCLCGAVRVKAKNVNNALGACHCGSCRKWSSGPYMSVDCGTDLEFENAANIAVFNSSEWADRGFCKTCGSNLYYRLKERGQYFISAALFGADVDFVFDHQVFIDEKPTYYAFENETDDMTGAELFAKYGASL